MYVHTYFVLCEHCKIYSCRVYRVYSYSYIPYRLVSFIIAFCFIIGCTNRCLKFKIVEWKLLGANFTGIIDFELTYSNNFVFLVLYLFFRILGRS